MSTTLADEELNELYQYMAKNAEEAAGFHRPFAELAWAIMLLARKIDELKQPSAEIARLKQVIAHCDVCQHYELLHEHLAREHI